MSIKSFIRTIPNYPKKGVMFRDITTLLNDAKGLRLTMDAITDRYCAEEIDVVVGLEARGFIFGPTLAYNLETRFVPIRKPGKLPSEVISEDYQLEYGSDRIEMHVDAINPGDRVLLIDDLLATGGTAEAAIKLLKKAKAEIIECCFVIDLPDLGGRARLEAMGQTVFSLCEFEGE